VSWQLRYLLPWDVLDRDRIRAAVEHVMRSGAGLELRRYKIEEKGPDLVSGFFYFEAALERRWGLLSKVDEDFRAYKIADTDEEFVHIDFEHIPADNTYGLPVQTYFEFYSNISGNRVFAGVGTEIVERIGRYFGVKCEPD
jgi:hypothetical protein